MKRFSPRERNGMIVLACLVLIFLGGSAFLRFGGCTRGDYEKFMADREAVALADSLASDSLASDSLASDSLAADSLEGDSLTLSVGGGHGMKGGRRKNRGDSVGAVKGRKGSRDGERSKKSAKKQKKEKEDPRRRSLRLEPVGQ